MGFITGMFKATVKTVLTPLAIASDVVNVVVGNEIDSTEKLLKSAVNDVSEGINDLSEGDIL